MIGTIGIRKNEFKAEITHANAKMPGKRIGKNSTMATLEPNMQIMIHFLNTLLRLCNGPKTATPMIPEMIGLPPTNDTANGKMLLNHGLSMSESTIDKALKTPKKHPKAMRSLR
jgi:hypothetical protein